MVIGFDALSRGLTLPFLEFFGLEMLLPSPPFQFADLSPTGC